MRRVRWKAQGKRVTKINFVTVTENPPLKEEEKKEGARAPISKNWRPDPDSERRCRQDVGNVYEAVLADHIDYCLTNNVRSHDHNALSVDAVDS